MIPADKITEIFCLADDFCKYFSSKLKRHHYHDSLSQQGPQMPQTLLHAVCLQALPTCSPRQYHTTDLSNCRSPFCCHLRYPSRKYCWGHVQALRMLIQLRWEYVSTSAFLYIRYSKAYPSAASARWDGYSDLSCTWSSMTKVRFWTLYSPRAMSMTVNRSTQRHLSKM